MIIKKDMILRKIGADNILVSFGNSLKDNNGLFMLTESACFLWEHIPECQSVQELAMKLFNEYDVTEEQALSDTEEFIDKLVEFDIIDKP